MMDNLFRNARFLDGRSRCTAIGHDKLLTGRKYCTTGIRIVVFGGASRLRRRSNHVLAAKARLDLFEMHVGDVLAVF